MGGKGSGCRPGQGGRIPGFIQAGNNRTGENQYTKFKTWQLQYPGEPFPLRHKDGTVEFVRKLPNRKRRGKRKTRCDKGTKRGTREQRELKAAGCTLYSEISPREIQEDLARTQREIDAYNEVERIKQNAKLSQNVERQREIWREASRKSYAKRIQLRKREKIIPQDRICRCCANAIAQSIRWCICDFKSTQNAICRSCFETLRRTRFDGD